MESTHGQENHVADNNWAPHSSVIKRMNKRILNNPNIDHKRENFCALDTLDGNRFDIREISEQNG